MIKAERNEIETKTIIVKDQWNQELVIWEEELINLKPD